MNLYKSLFVMAVSSAIAGALALTPPQPPMIRLSLPSTAKAGATLKGVVILTFADGLHAYQNPPSDPDLIPVKLTIPTKGFALKSAVYPSGKNEAVGGDPKPVKVYEGTVKIPVVISLPKRHGAVKLTIDAGYQQCNGESCFPPSDVQATMNIRLK